MKVILLFIIFFVISLASPSCGMSLGDVERDVIKLFVQSELIPQVKVTPAEKGRFVIEVTFSIGDRWGRDGFARDLARAAITRVFKSSLPVAQGIVRVYCTHVEAIHLAIGMNQAKQIDWTDGLSLSDFFKILRSCSYWGKSPEDRTYFTEHRQIIKPSPTASYTPDS
jgi:hypothetical protein